MLLVKRGLRHCHTAVLWELPVVCFGWVSALRFAVVVRAMDFFALASRRLATFLLPEIGGVVLLLLPPVAASAAVLKFAAVLVGARVFLGLPTHALVFAVLENVRPPPEVLPVVGVHALVALVVFVTHRTPDRLKVKHVEVSVALHPVELVN